MTTCRRALPLLTLLAAACTGDISRAPVSTPGDVTPGTGGRPASQPPLEPPRMVEPPVVDRGACRLPPRRLVSLSPEQISATARRLVDGGLNMTDPAAGNYLDVAGALTASLGMSGTRFSTDIDARDMNSDDYVAKLVELGRKLGSLVFDRLGRTDCLRGEPLSPGCASDWIAKLGRKAFRRPLTADESKELGALFESERARAGAKAAVSAVVQAMFLSPSFLFRSEIGSGTGAETTMTSHEIAQSISYWLLTGPPDAMLDAAADADTLHDPAVREAHVRRLLAKPAATSPAQLLQRVPGLRAFFYEWLEVNPAPAKEDRLYGVRQDGEWGWSRGELEAFIGDHLWNRGARWDALFTDNAIYANQPFTVTAMNKVGTVRLPKYPGGVCDPTFPRRPESCLKDPNKSDHLRIEAAELDGPRAGLLTSPLLMSTHSTFDRTDAVVRGKWVRHAFLCQEPPAPPPDVAALPPPPSRTLTSRERFAKHSEDPSCAACHRLMDPIGFALETYDAVGRYRTTELSPDLEKKGLYFESGRPIDTRGALVGVTIDGKHGDYAFNDARELAALLVRTDEAQRCFVSVAHAFAIARFGHPADACARDELRAAFTAGKLDVLDLFARIAAREDFVRRGAP